MMNSSFVHLIKSEKSVKGIAATQIFQTKLNLRTNLFKSVQVLNDMLNCSVSFSRSLKY